MEEGGGCNAGPRDDPSVMVVRLEIVGQPGALRALKTPEKSLDLILSVFQAGVTGHRLGHWQPTPGSLDPNPDSCSLFM